ncbi:hypothetical protein [Paenibacillus sp. P46E]|uniref:hypothetical protein n=1 Tax=Paenibacillus sp. P46E TaxID=1349436 RepID=UPI00093C4FF7|nr:hypothetical protein [Paenibacillus sp. P46E]OKP99457.1 hypothetical protein A3849_04410 [Paenibacillus sp. P46E]
MKKMVAVVLSGMMLMSFTACSTNGSAKNNSQAPKSTQVIGAKNVQIPNPFQKFDSIAEAEAFAGVTMTLPSQVPAGYTQKLIEAIKNDMIQITYQSGDEQLVIRKAKGSKDISGDHNKYSENLSLTVGDKKVVTKGDDGKIRVATWIDGGYTYSISSTSDEAVLDAAAVSAMVDTIR